MKIPPKSIEVYLIFDIMKAETFENPGPAWPGAFFEETYLAFLTVTFSFRESFEPSVVFTVMTAEPFFRAVRLPSLFTRTVFGLLLLICSVWL